MRKPILLYLGHVKRKLQLTPFCLPHTWDDSLMIKLSKMNEPKNQTKRPIYDAIRYINSKYFKYLYLPIPFNCKNPFKCSPKTEK